MVLQAGLEHFRDEVATAALAKLVWEFLPLSLILGVNSHSQLSSGSQNITILGISLPPCLLFHSSPCVLTSPSISPLGTNAPGMLWQHGAL